MQYLHFWFDQMVLGTFPPYLLSVGGGWLAGRTLSLQGAGHLSLPPFSIQLRGFVNKTKPKPCIIPLNGRIIIPEQCSIQGAIDIVGLWQVLKV